MADRAPRTREEAHAWVKDNGSIGFKVAAILNKLKLNSDETGILYVGCAYGESLVAVYRVMRSIMAGSPRIVGIDHCQALLDLADEVLEDEAGRMGDEIRDAVKLRRMDMRDFFNEDNIDSIQLLFPRGISTIVVTDVFEDLNEPLTRLWIRKLTAMLCPGGRIVFDVCYQPKCWSAAHFVQKYSMTPDGPPIVPPRLVGIINLAPTQFIQDSVAHVRGICQRWYVGASPDGDTATCDLECEWLGNTWSNFANSTISGIPDDMLPGNGLQSRRVKINDEATFVGGPDSEFWNTSRPLIKYRDGAMAYCQEAVRNIVGDSLPPTRTAEMLDQVLGGNGLSILQRHFRDWRPNHYLSDSRNGNAMGAKRSAKETIDGASAAIVDPHGLAHWDEFYLRPAAVLVSFRRRWF